MKGVDFLIIGFMKCGTTSLIRNLGKHPEIDVPKGLNKINKKAAYEIQFFNKNYDKGIEWYNNFFKENLLSGEKTPNYIHKFNVMKKIYEYNPNMKLIVNVRNPINRYISHCKMKYDRKNKGKITNKFLREKFNQGDFLDAGLYFKKIQNNILKKFFDRNQLYINVVDEIDDKTRNTYTSGYDKEKYGLNRAYRFQSQDQKTEQKMLDIFNFLNVSQDVNINYDVDYVSNYGKFQLDKDLEQQLKQYYRSDIYSLAELIDRPDIKKWVE